MYPMMTCLWFDGNAEEAITFYHGVFGNGEITHIARYGPGAPMPEGTALTVEFTLNGQKFLAINGGPQYSFTPAISMMVSVTTQEELDHIWDLLSADPAAEQCGWLVDKFGLSWQIVPAMMGELLSGGGDPEKAQRAMAAMLQMKKLNIAALRDA